MMKRLRCPSTLLKVIVKVLALSHLDCPQGLTHKEILLQKALAGEYWPEVVCRLRCKYTCTTCMYFQILRNVMIAG